MIPKKLTCTSERPLQDMTSTKLRAVRNPSSSDARVAVIEIGAARGVRQMRHKLTYTARMHEDLSLSHMRLRSRPVPLRRMKLVHGSRSGRLRSKLLEYQSRSLPHRSQVRKVHLFTHCSPKNFTACNFAATKRTPQHTKEALCSRTLQGPGLASARDSCSYNRVRVRARLECSLV